MQLPQEIKQSMSESVLCWLATTARDHTPNVSPKEIFNHFGEDKMIIANIASPQTVRNIRANPKVCVSFINILSQKGFQLKGSAQIIDKNHREFLAMETILLKMTGGTFPFKTITKITVHKVKPLIAPRYLLFPETTEKQQIDSALKAYGIA